MSILAVFPGDTLCAVEAGPEKAGGTLSRLPSAGPGLPERLAQLALNGRNRHLRSSKITLSIPAVFPEKQPFAKLENSSSILAVFPGDALCAVEAGQGKAGGTLSRLPSAGLGLLERLAQQALNGHTARIARQFIMKSKGGT